MKRLLAGGLGLIASAAYLAYAARGLGWTDLQQAFAALTLWPLLVHAAAFALVMRARAARFALALSGPRALHWRESLPSQMAGYLANFVLPMQAGEVARVAVASRGLQIPAAEVVAVIALERVIDLLIALAGLACATLLLPGMTAGLSRAATLLAAGVGTGALGLLWAGLRPAAIQRLLARLTPVLPARLAAPLTQTAHAALEGLSLVRAPARAVRYAGWCSLQWVGWLLSVATTLWAVDLWLGPLAWLLASALSTLALILPAAPGYLGSFQLAYGLALTPLGADPAAAFLAATLLQGLTIVLALCTALAVQLTGRSLRPPAD